MADEIEVEDKIRVLVVDDEAMMRDLMRDALTLAGMEVDTAANIEGAQRLLKARPYDVLVVDIKLKGESGLDLARFAKALEHTIEVIVVTGHASVESVIEAVKFEAFDYMLKPLDLNELRSAVERAAARSKAARRSKKALEELVESGKVVPLFTRPKHLSYGEAEITHIDSRAPDKTKLEQIRSKLQSLKMLWELKEIGAITEEEYKKLKDEILGKSE